MSPTTLAKPIMCTSTPVPCACTSTASLWILLAHAAFRASRATAMGSIEFAGGVLLQHDGRDQRAGEIVGHEPAAMPAFRMFSRTFASASGVGTNSAVDHVAGFDAVLDHFHVAHVGREQRLHAAAVDAVHDQHFVGGLLQRVEELRLNMLPSRAISAISTRFAPPNSALVLHEGLHVLVLERQLLGERGIDAQAAHRHRAPARRSAARTPPRSAARWPKMSLSSVGASFDRRSMCVPAMQVASLVEAHGAHATLARPRRRNPPARAAAPTGPCDRPAA